MDPKPVFKGVQNGAFDVRRGLGREWLRAESPGSENGIVGRWPGKFN